MAGDAGATHGQNRIKSVESAFEIIEALRERGECGVSELADHLDIPTSTAHVYLTTLHEAGYVVKDDDRYHLGLRFLELGGHVRQNMNIYGAARPRIDQLSQKTGEVANLGVEEGGKRVLLYTSESPDGVFDNSPTGQLTNMHWTALGKALLAHLPEERIDAIVDEHGLPRATPNTITDREELYEELETVRERGYSIEDEDRREGIKAVGVPVLAGDDSVTAAVSLSGPKRRIGDQVADSDLLDALRSTVNVIELKLQHY